MLYGATARISEKSIKNVETNLVIRERDPLLSSRKQLVRKICTSVRGRC